VSGAPAGAELELPPSLGGIACDWLEEHLLHGPGDVLGMPYRLDDEKRAFIWRAYEYVPDGMGGWRRRYRRATLSRRKGFAKSELAAGLSWFEFLGAARLDGFDANGQPVGRPVLTPNIPMAATAEDQVEETLYSVFVEMPRPRLVDDYSVDLGTGGKTMRGPGKVQTVTSSSVSRDGARPTFIPKDETHLWTSRALKKLNRVLERNLAKLSAADPWSCETTTAYAPGEGSVAEDSHAYAKKVLTGEIVDPKLLFDHLEASHTHDVSTDEGLKAAILEASGLAAAYANVEAIVDQFRQEDDEAEGRRYWLNQVVAAATQWLAPASFDPRAARTKVVAQNELVAFGFDGSLWDDATALIGCRLIDGHIFVPRKPDGSSAIWEKPDGPRGRGWEVPRSEVDATVYHVMRYYDVRRFYGDPPYWQDEMVRWHAEWGDVIAEFWTQRETQMVRATERFHTDVLTGAMTHDGNPVLARHVANARKKTVRAGTVIVKEHRHSENKIDSAVAAILAYEARADAVEAGELKRRKRARLYTF
jgi:phage terminase large subunit-like protein